jgi:hypothetical protein
MLDGRLQAHAIEANHGLGEHMLMMMMSAGSRDR